MTLKKHDGNRASARSQCISAVPVLELKPERSVIPWESYPLIFPFIFDDGLNRETGKDVLVKILWALQNKTILYTTIKYFNNIMLLSKTFSQQYTVHLQFKKAARWCSYRITDHLQQNVCESYTAD